MNLCIAWSSTSVNFELRISPRSPACHEWLFLNSHVLFLESLANNLFCSLGMRMCFSWRDRLFVSAHQLRSFQFDFWIFCIFENLIMFSSVQIVSTELNQLWLYDGTLQSIYCSVVLIVFQCSGIHILFRSCNAHLLLNIQANLLVHLSAFTDTFPPRLNPSFVSLWETVSPVFVSVLKVVQHMFNKCINHYDSSWWNQFFSAEIRYKM